MKFSSIFKISNRAKILIMVAWALSLYVYLLMKFFNKYARFKNKNRILKHSASDIALIKDIKTSIRVASKLSPWKNVCRHQAYQAQILCRWFGLPCQVYIGFKKEEHNLIQGHAWTISYKQMITGQCDPAEYQIQAVYSI